jgi:predicted alpha/beta hydrolase
MLKVVETPVVRRRLIKTEDGAELGGTLYMPPYQPRAAMVINGATGVPQRFYNAFAQWAAAERGIAVLTYDYRGMWRSTAGNLRQCYASMQDWGLRDNLAARLHLRQSVPDVPLWVMGHSLGTMLLPMQSDVSGIDRVTGVASGFVHHSDHPWPFRARALYFWFGLPPLATKLLGYMPGSMLGLGADLPAKAFFQWRRWCITRGGIENDLAQHGLQANWTRSGAPVRLISFTDDTLCPESSTHRLARTYAGCATVVSIDPARYGLRNVGHTAAFSRRNSALWDTLLGAETRAY